jgi:hypothetical protein
MRRLLLAIGACAFAGLFMGHGYAALTAPPFTAKAMIVLPPGAPVPGLGQAGVQRLTPSIVQVSAHGSTAAEAQAADAAAVRSYLSGALRARLLGPPAVVPRHQDERLRGLAALGALVGALAGAVGAATGRRTARP